jgi:arylsulfate sulfotransferase
MKRLINYSTFFALLLLCGNADAAITATFSAVSPSPAPMGSVTHWTAASDAPNPAEYRWSVTKPNGLTSIVVDFDSISSFDYMPLMEGSYTLTLDVRDTVTLDQGSASATFVASSLQTSPSVPVVSSTANSLVALFSTTCSSGNLRVYFAPNGITPLLSGTATTAQPCFAGHSIAVIVAGMKPNTQYTLQQQVSNGFALQNGTFFSFTTGPASPNFPVPTVNGTSTSPEKFMLMSFISVFGGGTQGTAAWDLDGNMVWYSTAVSPGSGAPIFLYRPMLGGTMIVSSFPLLRLQELDLLGNVVRQTSITRLAEQLGPAFPQLRDINHDAIRLPNGNTAIIVGVQQSYTNGTQGSSSASPINLVGDAIVVLNKDWQVVWSWNPYTNYDITRGPIAPAHCAGAGCIDWMHANSLLYTDDNNFVMSMRHQDLLIKIDYANGGGTGRVLWRLGNGGDFTILNPNIDAYPWFSGQHSLTWKGNYLTLFDNGITRLDPGVSFNRTPTVCCSRGQAWTINENSRTVSLVTNASMGDFSDIIGSSQQLLNGNLHFLSGFANSGTLAHAQEFTPAGVPVYTFDINNSSYRAFRMRDMYTP